MPRTDKDSIGRTGCHNLLCEGDVHCPLTNKDECSKVIVLGVMLTTTGTVVQRSLAVVCFGCGQIHNVPEQGVAA